jgi:hypothetical protein
MANRLNTDSTYRSVYVRHFQTPSPSYVDAGEHVLQV